MDQNSNSNPQNYWKPEDEQPKVQPQPVPPVETPIAALSQAAPAASKQPQPAASEAPPVPRQAAEGTPSQQTPDSATAVLAASPAEAPAEEIPAQESPVQNETLQTDTQTPVIEWQASEYIHHEKGIIWFIALGLITAGATALAMYVRQWVFAFLIVTMGVAMGLFAKRPPHDVQYRIDARGVSIDEKLFPFSQFKGFGVLNEGAFYSVQLRPSKRFMPGISIYFAQANGEKIFDALAAHLPMEKISQDPLDKMMHWLRF